MNSQIQNPKSEIKIRAVVFDLDGLMFNTEDIFNEVGRIVLARRGKVMGRELLQQMMGRRAPEALQRMIEFHSLPDTVPGLIDETRTLFTELAVDRLAPMPGLYELLEHIETPGSRQLLEKLVSDPTQFLAAVQIGVTVATMLSSAFGAATVSENVTSWLVDMGVEPSVAEPVALVGVTVSVTLAVAGV